MTLYSGFIQGAVTYDDNGVATLLPFGNTIMEASVNLTSELQFTETFGINGLKGKSAACPFKQEVSISVSTEDISWATLQAVLGSRATTRTAPLPINEELIAVDNGGTIEITLSQTPSAGTELTFASLDGENFTGVLTGSVVSFAADVDAGDRVVAQYFYDVPSNADQHIEYGKADVISEYSIYGTFKGCPEDIILIADRAVLETNVEFGVGDSPASAGMTLSCLRNAEGTYATLIRVV